MVSRRQKYIMLTSRGGIDEQFTWHRNQEQNVSASGAFFSCYTEVLQSEAFISTAAGVEMTGADGLGSE